MTTRARSIALDGAAAERPRTSHRRLVRWSGSIVAVLSLLAILVYLYGNAFVRIRMEQALNRQLKGYSVTLPQLRLNLFGLSVTLRNVTVTEAAHPSPPVAHLPSLSASVDWRALLHARLVASFVFDRPDVHINLQHFRAEVNDTVKLKDRGWQRAAEEIYPLKINRLIVDDGKLTYIDEDPKRPMQIANLDLRIENIRNIHSAPGKYPSPLHLSATVFETGHVQLAGNADLFAEPFAAFDTDVKIERVPLGAVKPVAAHANLQLTGGTLAAAGHVEYAPQAENVRLKTVAIDGLHVDYIHAVETAAKETQHVEQAKTAARNVSNERTTTVQVDDIHLSKAVLAYVDRNRGYRVSLDDADLRVRDLSSHATPKPASLRLMGRFMNAGNVAVSSEFRPVNKKPEFALNVQIDNTPLTTMNDLFRAYGNFDVAAGTFAFYSELHAHDGKLDGYVKPLFNDMKVYSRSQDAQKPILHQVYEGLVGGVAGLLRNTRADVATSANVSGRIDEPQVSTLQVVLRLIQNAFFSSILPGFENEAQRASVRQAAQ